MRIGILTQPLNFNYGGILQNYALQCFLKKMGHETWTIDRQPNEYKSLVILQILSLIKRTILRYFLRRNIIIRPWLTKSEKKKICKNTKKFIHDNIRLTVPIISNKQFGKLSKYALDAYIVGSDQVWRPLYSPCITNYFLDFVKTIDLKRPKRIAYAASFGVDKWEFTLEQTKQCSLLIKLFDAISVREEDAILLCKEQLEVDAKKLIDPTLLLRKEDYIQLVEKYKVSKSKGSLMTYLLDQNPEKEKIVKSVSDQLNIKSFSVMPKYKTKEKDIDIKDCIYPPVTEWIRGFMDAEFVITDSFHGTVFAILFNKPFISIGNQERGLSRFTSLLNTFGLENRLIMSSQELTTEIIHENIDFEKLNNTLNSERLIAQNFLTKALA